jgi:GNAT superfamily N-acetyltransferase
LVKTQLHVDSVLVGSSSGEVYVDDREAPGAALAIAGEGHYLAARGRLPDGFAKAVNAKLPRDSIFVLFYDGGTAPEDLAQVVAQRYAVPARRCCLRLQAPLMRDWKVRAPEGFSLQRVDRAMLGGELGDGLLEDWSSVDAFCARGFGFCLLHEGRIVSRCVADYAQGQRCEIGVATSWGYRRRGFATLVAAAAVEHACEAGFTEIGWHCWANNAGSLAVARNVGFEKVSDYHVWLNHWAAENVSDVSGEEFRSFAEGYECAFEVDPPQTGFPHVVAAKAWSLCGEPGRCYRQIAAAVDTGWLQSVGQLRDMWPEFFTVQHLDRSAEWQQLARRLR